jgi:hypothetical protein
MSGAGSQHNAFTLLPDDAPAVGYLDATVSVRELLMALSTLRDDGVGEVDFRALCLQLSANYGVDQMAEKAAVSVHGLRKLRNGSQRQPKHNVGERLIVLYRTTFVGRPLPRVKGGGYEQ